MEQGSLAVLHPTSGFHEFLSAAMRSGLDGLPSTRAARRKAFRVCLLAEPTADKKIAAIRAIAASVASNGEGQASVYVGTAAGQILRYLYTPNPKPPEGLQPWRGAGQGQAYSPASSPGGHSTGSLSSRSSEQREAAAECQLAARATVGKRAVGALCVLPHARRLAALCDGQALLLDVDSLGGAVQLGVARGATLLARQTRPEENEGSPAAGASEAEDPGGGAAPPPPAAPSARGSRLAVSTAKRIFLFEVRQRQAAVHRDLEEGAEAGEGGQAQPAAAGRGVAAALLRELPAVEGAVAMVWARDSLIVGTKAEYFLVSVLSGEVVQLFALPRDTPPPLPLLSALPGGAQVLLQCGRVGVIVTPSGQPSGGALTFRLTPEAVGSSPPYVVTAANCQLDVYSQATGAHVQELALPGGATGSCLVVHDDTGRLLLIATANKVWFVQQVPAEEQAKELLRRRECDEAVAVAAEKRPWERAEDVSQRVGTVHAEAGFLLLEELHFSEAADHFAQSAVMQPSEVFPLFPEAAHRWLALVPRKRYWGLHSPPVPLADMVKNRLELRHREARSPELVISDVGKPGGGHIAAAGGQESASADDLVAAGKRSIARFLAKIRRRSAPQAEEEGVDTLLMHLYCQLGAAAEIQQLASRPNSCLIEDLEGPLRKGGHLEALAWLLEGKGQLERAVSVWADLARGDVMASSHTGESGGQEAQAKALAEVTRLLHVSSDRSLIFEHCQWIVGMDPEKVLAVLTSPERRALLLPRDVLELLSPSEHPLLRLRYLHWLVQHQGSTRSTHHTAYACSLADVSALELPPCCKQPADVSGTSVDSWSAPARPSGQLLLSGCLDCAAVASASAAATAEGDGPALLRTPSTGSSLARTGSERRAAEDALDASPPLVGAAIGRSDSRGGARGPTTSGGSPRFGSTREHLQALLQASRSYDTPAVLAHVQGLPLWMEQVLLLRRSGDHKAALRILALELGDSRGAERYCAELSDPEPYYMLLLELYLQPGGGREPLHTAAVRLLHCHAAHLDPLKVLEALAPSTSLQKVTSTLALLLRERTHRHRQGQIVRQLARADNLAARVDRIKERSRHAVVSEDRACRACHNRLGTKLFALLPNDVIVCYQCLRRLGDHIDPVTGQDFRQLS